MTTYIIYDMDSDGQEYEVATADSLEEARDKADKGIESGRLVTPRIQRDGIPSGEPDDVPF